MMDQYHSTRGTEADEQWEWVVVGKEDQIAIKKIWLY